MNEFSTTASEDQPVDQEDEERPDDGGDEPGRFAFLIPADLLADEPRQQGSGDAQEDGHDASARVSSRHEQFGNSAGDQPDYDPAEDSIGFDHLYPLPVPPPKRAADAVLIAPTSVIETS